MSEINLGFVVEPNNINIVADNNNINFTPSDIQLSVYTGSAPVAGGNNTQLQYNNNGLLGGIPNVTYNGSKLSLGNVANVLMTGGTNGYVLQTDGTGNLSWTAQSGNGGNGTPGGANTQIQYNDAGSFGGNVGFTFNEVSGNVNLPNDLIVAGTIYGNFSGNSSNANYANFAGTAFNVSGSNVSGEVANAAYANAANTSNLATYATTANSVAGANVSGTVANATFALNAGNSNLANTANSVAGANVTGTVANATFATTAGSATTAGTVTTNAQPNITSLGTLTTLSLSSSNISLGNNSITYGNSGIAIGNNAEIANSGVNYPPIAIGREAYATNAAISIGYYAGKFASNVSANAKFSVAIGQAAGYGNTRGGNSIAIGQSAGVNQQANTIAIGRGAGYYAGNNSIHIGNEAGSGPNALANLSYDNTIILNATGANLENNIANSFVVKPIRNATQGNYLYYDFNSGEITYDTGSGGANTASGANTQVQFNTGNLLDASANFTFNTSTNNLSVTGNIVGTAFYGAGTGLTSISGANVTGTVANATFATTAGSATTAGTVTTNAQPNITSVGSLTSLGVSGNITGANVAGGNLVSANFLNGTLTTAAQPNVTSLGTITSLVATTMKITPTTVAGLPSASSAGVGARRFITDGSTAPAPFGQVVVGAGSTPSPVYSDGTDWRIG
jgi:hypothetical protein